MSRYERDRDRLVGHDYPGVRGSGFVAWELDELEVGARVACALDDPEQVWWLLCDYMADVSNTALHRRGKLRRLLGDPLPDPFNPDRVGDW